MQPHCRRFSFESDLPGELKATYDLGDLKSAGKSGLVSVLIGLKWWAALRDSDARWGQAVRDLKNCFLHITRK